VSPTDEARARPRLAPWDPGFASRSPLFASVAEVAHLLAGEESFPEPERLDALFAPRAGVRFARAAPKPRRARPSGSGREAYDTRIVLEGVVPTRPGSWHDLLNALVWATFPLAKRALHARQHALVVPARPGEVRHRPRALDALALFDEGGVVVGACGAALVFGHAILEGAVQGWPVPTASALPLHVSLGGAPGTASRGLDGAIAQVVSDPGFFSDPAVLARFDLRTLARTLAGGARSP
jgi:hypothetical protein